METSIKRNTYSKLVDRNFNYMIHMQFDTHAT